MTPPVRSRRHRLAVACQKLVDASWFGLASFVVIVVNSMALGLETYGRAVVAAGGALRMVEYACLAFFVLELLVRFGAHLRSPAGFFRDRWNVFDLLILAAPLAPGVRENVTLLRLLRLARIVRAFRLFPSLRVILVGIRRSLPGLGSFLLVTVLVLYGYAMLGWMLFGAAYPDRYGTVGQAMLTLFLLLSLDGITDTLQAGREVTEWAVLYYVSYMVTACYLLTNLLVGVVLNALEEAHQEERAAAERTTRRKTPDGLTEPSVHEQLAQLRAIITNLERRLPEYPAGDTQGSAVARRHAQPGRRGARGKRGGPGGGVSRGARPKIGKSVSSVEGSRSG